MFNVVTEKLIKLIPHVDGVDIERLPQFLSMAYAKIITLRTRCPKDCSLKNEDIIRDVQELSVLCNTLELMLISGQKIESRSSVAYVSALGRKFIAMTETEVDSGLSLNYIPSKLYSALLFLISGNFSDAEEIMKSSDSDSDIAAHKLHYAVYLLASGKLSTLRQLNCSVKQDDSIFMHVESLLWIELIQGIKALGNSLQTGDKYNDSFFRKVNSLSVFVPEELGGKDIYVAPYLISLLLFEAATTLVNHSLFKAECPRGIDNDEWHKVLVKLAETRPYLWQNHIDAIEAGVLRLGKSSVVTFPTGSGKTTLSELKMATALLSCRNVLYLVPTHALEFQVHKSVAKLLDDIEDTHINIDGEFTILEEGTRQVLVMTPERCLTLLKIMPEKPKDIGLVVFDEFHLINATETNNRSLLAMTLVVELLDVYPEADFLFLSAMVSNGELIAKWIGNVTGRDCLLLDNLWKPTCQLQGCIVYDKDEIDSLNKCIRFSRLISITKHPSKKLKNTLEVTPKCLFSLKSVWNTDDTADYYHLKISPHKVRLDINPKWYLIPNCNDVAVRLASDFSVLGLKTIVFVLTPEYAVSNCKKTNNLLNDYKKKRFLDLYQGLIERITMELGNFEYSYLNICDSATIHQANMLVDERILSEKYFMKDDGVNIMYATPTVSQGVNLPADVVIIAGNKRYDGENGVVGIEAHDILNAAGRAGRAGFRSQGMAILIPSTVLSMGGNKIDDVWMDIKDEVFSKGDHCLEIKDPYEDVIINGVQRPLLENVFRLYSDRSSVIRKMRKTLVASKMTLEGKGKELTLQIDGLVNRLELQDSTNFTWQEMIATNNGYTLAIINSMASFVSSVDTSWYSVSVMKMLDIFKQWALYDVSNFGTCIELSNCKASVMSINSKKDNDVIDGKDIDKLFKLLLLYVQGATFETIEKAIDGIVKGYLIRARKFVLKVIPAISYVCGVFVQVVLKSTEENDRIKIVNNNVRTFASCVKEGVCNYEMLLYKYQSHTRIEAHRNIIENEVYNAESYFIDRAIEDYNRAIEQNRRDALLYTGRGHLKFLSGDIIGAIYDYDSAIMLNSNDAKMYRDRGYKWSCYGNKEKAIRDYERAIELNPNDAYVYKLMGDVISDIGDIREAIRCYDKAIELNPNFAIAYNYRSILYEKLADEEPDVSKKEELMRKSQEDNAKAERLK